MLEQYYKNKANYKKAIILIKCGNFYEAIDKDALIVSKLLGYKISKLLDTVKCGFPISSLSKVTSVLDNNSIDYVVVENNIVVNNKTFEDNTYDNYDFDINNIKYNFLRINKITKFLNDNVYNNINELLEEIEELINERR